MILQTLDQRFWSRVNRDGPIADPPARGQCWLWLAGGSGGYGAFWDGTRNVRAHVYAYEQRVGAIPSGLQLDHLCCRPACVRFDHLEPVTFLENIERARRRRRPPVVPPEFTPMVAAVLREAETISRAGLAEALDIHHSGVSRRLDGQLQWKRGEPQAALRFLAARFAALQLIVTEYAANATAAAEGGDVA